MSPRADSKAPLARLRIDGASQGNPGPSGIGVVLEKTPRVKPIQVSLFVGQTTNNVAETLALIVGLSEALRAGVTGIEVLTDSQLLEKQLIGDYRVKDPTLRLLHVVASHLARSFDRFKIRHVPREENRLADRLAAKAIQEERKRHGLGKRVAASSAAISPGQSTFWSL